MTEKYEEKLWGKIDFLHEKTLKEHNNINIFSEIITKYQQTLTEFSKSIDNIKNKDTKIIDENDNLNENTLELTLINFKEVLNSHIEEFKECSEHMKKSIITPIIKTIDDKYIIEKDMYNQYNKTKNIYNINKQNLEKAKNEFEISAKLCESNIFNLIQIKNNFLNSKDEISKSEERMKISIKNAKNLEDKYYKCLEEANKSRENEINKQKELLKYYQIINTDFYVKLNCIISYFIPMVKKMYLSILLAMDALDNRCKNINIQKDINNFIEKNKTDLKEDEPIPFIPYNPEANLTSTTISGNDKKELETLDINYNVLLTLHQNFRDIRKDLNMKEEAKKYRLRFLCTQIFKIGPGVGFKPEEKKELITLLKEQIYKSFFLITLSKQRTKGRFQRSETLIKDLSEILHNILDESQKKKDYESAKNCIILSQTFYYEKKNNKNKKENKKIYLFDYIKYYKWLKSLDFWEGIIEYMIQNDIKKNEIVNKKNKIVNESPEEIKSRLSNIGFSQVLSYSNNMLEFQIDKNDIIKVVDIFVKKYGIDPAMAEAIYGNIKTESTPEGNEEDEQFFKKLEEEYENNKKNNDNDNGEEDDEDENNVRRLGTRHRALTITENNLDMVVNIRTKTFKKPNNSDIVEEEDKKEINNNIIDNKIIEENQIKSENETIDNNKIKDNKNEEKNYININDEKNDNNNENKIETNDKNIVNNEYDGENKIILNNEDNNKINNE